MASDDGRGRTIAWGAAGLLALAILAYIGWSQLPPPQLEHDEQVFNTVDALFTAISSRDATRVDECARRFESYHGDGRMTDSVKALLDSVVGEARAGKWEPAARRLYDFILGQRGTPLGS